LYVPGAHGLHASIDPAGVDSPARHPRHVVLPASGWYVPARHAGHADARPAVGPYVPAAHGVQELAPVEDEYVPGAQVVGQDVGPPGQ
jgi:hypothetical protein